MRAYSRMEGLRPRREALGLSRADAAEAVGVTRQAWYAWETGNAMPSSGLLPGIAELLACRIEDLYTAPDFSEGEPGGDGQ